MMLYGGKPPKPVPPPKINGPARISGFNGPQAYTYNVLAKQPGSDYKIRLRNIERVRMETLRAKNEEDFKSLQRHNLLEEMIDVADKKYLYNRIKKMVECGMKANEHLFMDEECPEPEIKVEEEEPERPKISEQDIIEKARELKKKREEEERKIVEEKHLQLFITNSEELRYAAMAKRKKDIANINYKFIQENERVMKEQRAQKREQANLENLEILKNQTHEKEEQKRKLLEKKHQFRKELYKQVQQKEEIRKQEKELKKIECEELKKLNEKLNEEEELNKLEQIKKKMQRKEEIKQFTEERAKLFSKMNKATSTFDETFALSMGQNLKDNTAEILEAKIQLKREIEMFMKHHTMIKEERQKQSEEISNILMKQINEIEEFKRSIDRETVEARRKRMEEGNKTLKEQLRSHEILLEQQKELKRKTYEESVREHEEYLKDQRLLCEKKKQFKCQFRKDLNDQINSRNVIIQKQREIDMENHQNCMLEIAEQEQLLKKLLNEL